MKNKKKHLSKDAALEKLRRYCAYQERCHQEVRSKLLSLDIFGNDLEQIITALIEENFLNEERFARAYARGKFRFKQWGRIKIKQALKHRHISSYCIRKAMEEIEPENYRRTLSEILKKKKETISESNPYIAKQKIINYALRRGYEAPLVREAVDQLF